GFRPLLAASDGGRGVVARDRRLEQEYLDPAYRPPCLAPGQSGAVDYRDSELAPVGGGGGRRLANRPGMRVHCAQPRHRPGVARLCQFPLIDVEALGIGAEPGVRRPGRRVRPAVIDLEILIRIPGPVADAVACLRVPRVTFIARET